MNITLFGPLNLRQIQTCVCILVFFPEYLNACKHQLNVPAGFVILYLKLLQFYSLTIDDQRFP